MASSSPLSIPILPDGFLPGPETFNQLANAVRRIRSNRPGLNFRLMPDAFLSLFARRRGCCRDRRRICPGRLC